MKQVKKIRALSLGKVMGLIYGMMGLLFGVIMSVAVILGSTFGATGDNKVVGIIFGVGAAIFVPVIYGVMGFVSGVVSGWLYNIAVRWTGGLEVEILDKVESLPEPASKQP